MNKVVVVLLKFLIQKYMIILEKKLGMILKLMNYFVLTIKIIVNMIHLLH